MPTPISINGVLYTTDTAPFPIQDGAFLYGLGCFETILVHNNTPFLLERHLNRLYSSAATFGIHCPLSQKDLISTISELIKKTGLSRATLNIYITVGDRNRQKPSFKFENPLCIAVCHPLDTTPSVPVTCTLQEIHYPRGPLDAHKTMSYAHNILELQRANGLTPLLHTTDGQLLETPTSTIIGIQNNIVTTVDHPHILPSITQAYLFDLAKTLGLETEKKPISVQNLNTFEELCLVNSTQGIIYIDSVHQIPHLRSGPIITQLSEAYLNNLFIKNN